MERPEQTPATAAPGKVKSTLSVKVDPRLHREFAAACQLRDETIQDAFGRLMAATVAETFAAIRTGPAT